MSANPNLNITLQMVEKALGYLDEVNTKSAALHYIPIVAGPVIGGVTGGLHGTASGALLGAVIGLAAGVVTAFSGTSLFFRSTEQKVNQEENVIKNAVLTRRLTAIRSDTPGYEYHGLSRLEWDGEYLRTIIPNHVLSKGFLRHLEKMTLAA